MITEDAAKNLLCEAKNFAEAENYNQALCAIKSCADYAVLNAPFCNKLAKFAAKNASKFGLKKLKIALLSSSTTVFIEPLLKLFGLCNNFEFDIKSGDFGNWRQDILNRQSWLSDFNADAVIISTNWRDTDIKSISQADSAQNLVSEIQSLWSTLKDRFQSTAIIQLNFDIPAHDSCGFLAQNLPTSQTQILKKAAGLLVESAAKDSVVIVDALTLQAKAGLDKWENPQIWYNAKQHPSLEALPLLAREFSRAVKAKFTAQKKVCVLDLDNTLWGGVIGEDLLGGIKLGAPDSTGEAFAAFQQYLLELKNRGILLAVCSKNNEQDAKIPFLKHPSSILKLEDFVSFKANWKPKSENIDDIAKSLNLGLDSFVFIDDNPAEIREVSSAFAQIECLQLPKDPADYIAAVDNAGFFDTVTYSTDDLGRTSAYIENAARQASKSSSANLEDFLASLEMKCRVENINADNITRVVQLLGKTNQFNLTTKRHTAEAVNTILAEKNSYARCFRLKDKFGDNGIVGILIARNIAAETLDIDSFVMSCRVIGRTLEKFMCNDIFKFAKAAGLKKISGTYIPTPKNAQTADLYGTLGFQETTAQNASERKWECKVDMYKSFDLKIAPDEK